MKKNNSRDYYINTNNTHLLNALEENYYIEIGTINLSKIDKLLHGQVLDLTEFIYFDLLNEGIGKITSDTSSDVYYQLNYLLSYRQKSSTRKFFLTCGIARYRDEKGIEKYAPIVLIPIDIDYQRGKIRCSSEAITNRLLLRLISKRLFNSQDEQRKYVDIMSSPKFSDIGTIDKYCQDLVTDADLSMIPINYLTVCNIEYYDFNINNDYFFPERSIYETNLSQIYHDYFQYVKAILPTNIYQKHVLLKAHNGENFGVEGRLGSGKTYTILNIMADFVSKDKKVLYVNQDLDNIWDVERNLRYLSLDNYMHNLTTKTRDLEVKPVLLPEVNEITFNQEPLKFFKRMDEQLSIKIHGFNFEYLAENLAIIKRLNREIKEVPLEINLERHEYEFLCDLLDTTEQALHQVDPFEVNVWRNLQTSYNNITDEDIVERTKNIYLLQKELCKKIDTFCKRYNIIEPKNIHDLYRFIENVISFEIAKPQSNWKIEKNRIDAKRALKEIGQAVDENYTLQQFYKNSISERYVPGRMLAILEEICGKHLSLTEDQVYINRILSVNTKLHSLVDSITTNIKKSNELYSNIKAYFNITSFDDKTYKMLNDCLEYLQNNRIPRTFVKEYINEISQLLRVGEKIESSWKTVENCRAKINRYLLPAVRLEFDEIANIINNKKAKKVLQKHLDNSLLRQDHIDKDEILSVINNYYIAGSVLNVELPQTNDKNNYEKYWQECVNLYNLIKKHFAKVSHLQTFFNKQVSNSPYNVGKVEQTLKSFKEETINTSSLITQLKNYHIEVQEELPLDKINALVEWNRYLSNIINLKNEITVIFKTINHVTIKEIIELIDVDKRQLELNKMMDRNDKEYKRLLGDNYKKYDTIISDTGQSLEHFEDFVIRLKDLDDVDKLLKSKTYERFLEDTTQLRQLHSDWISCFRLFSVCFQKGQSSLHNMTFKEVMNILQLYHDKVDQIPSVVVVINCLFKMMKFNLKGIIALIREGKLRDNMKNRLGYTVMNHYLQEFCKSSPILLDFNWMKEQFNSYEKAERDYCTRNILDLMKNINKKGKMRTTTIPFYEYNRFIEATIRNANIYLADLNIFNSDLDLSYFDLVIIDDGHLSSANKYNRIMECRQVIVFGDKKFQSSVSNSLMQRMKDTTLVSFANRYVKMTPKFNNKWSQKNRYIYALETPIKVHAINNLAEFAVNIVEYFKKNNRKIINVLIGNDTTKREVYESIVKLLQMTYSALEIVEILCYNIRIINVNEEGSRYVNDAYIYYTDFIEYEQTVKNLIFKNFVVVENSVQIFYTLSKNDEQNKKVLKDINATIAKTNIKTKQISGISKIFLNELVQRGIKAEAGFGKFDIIVQDKTNYAIIFEGKESSHSFALIDDYQYYYRQYIQRGWKIKVIYVYDLIDNYDAIFEDTIEYLIGE